MSKPSASQPKTLALTRFGNPILRRTATLLTPKEIVSSSLRALVRDMRHTNETKQLGVGLAAPQVGYDVAIAILDIKPTKARPKLPTYFQAIFNPSYAGIGRRSAKWEGCLSSGRGKDVLFGKALRWKKIQAKWFDERGEHHQEILSGIIAHVFQHETDHLNGVLFVDHVRDTTSYMLADEYKKRIVNRDS